MSEDPHSRAYGMANSTVLAELLKLLISDGLLPPEKVKSFLNSAKRQLLDQHTDPSAAAAEQIQIMQEVVGVAR